MKIDKQLIRDAATFLSHSVITNLVSSNARTFGSFPKMRSKQNFGLGLTRSPTEFKNCYTRNIFNKYITIFPCVCPVIDDMMSQYVKNRKVRHEPKSSGVTVVLYTLVTSSVIYYSTHTRKNVIYLFYK